MSKFYTPKYKGELEAYYKVYVMKDDVSFQGQDLHGEYAQMLGITRQEAKMSVIRIAHSISRTHLVQDFVQKVKTISVQEANHIVNSLFTFEDVDNYGNTILNDDGTVKGSFINYCRGRNYI